MATHFFPAAFRGSVDEDDRTMHEDYFSRGPIVGVVMAAVGVSGYLYHSAVEVLASTQSGAAVVAQAVATGGWTWDDVGKAVSGALVLLGGLLAWASSQRSKWHADRIEERRREEEAARESRRRDDDAAREKSLKDALAQIEILRAMVDTNHAAHEGHLASQDETLAQIKQAIATPIASPPPDHDGSK